MTVREMLSRLDSQEISEWIAYDSIEPFGEERADLRSGMICSVIANVKRGKNQPPFKAVDFMPYTETKKTKESLSERLKAAFKELK